MQQVLRSIYSRWFPFPPILSSSSSSFMNSTARNNPDSHDLVNAQSDTSLVTRFNISQISSTSVSISVLLSPSDLSKDLINPTINLNYRPWSKIMILGQPSSADSPDSKIQPNHLTILVYGLEPGTVYDLEVELTSGDDYYSDHSSSTSISVRHDQNHPEVPSQSVPSCSSVELGEGTSHPPLDFETQRLKLSHLSRSQAQVSINDPDGPPPPYTSHDPASPTHTCRSDVNGNSSISFNSFSPSDPDFSDSPSAEMSIDPNLEAISHSTPTDDLDGILQKELQDKNLSLCQAIEDNAPLKESLHDLEQRIKHLDEENMEKTVALSKYDEAEMSKLTKQIERQTDELKRKVEDVRELEANNERKLETLHKNNQILKTRWEESVQKLGDLKNKLLKPIEIEIDELKRKLLECEKQIESIDLESGEDQIDRSNQYQVVVRPRTSSNHSTHPTSMNSDQSICHRPNQSNQNPPHTKTHRKAKWKSMDDHGFINSSFVSKLKANYSINTSNLSMNDGTWSSNRTTLTHFHSTKSVHSNPNIQGSSSGPSHSRIPSKSNGIKIIRTSSSSPSIDKRNRNTKGQSYSLHSHTSTNTVALSSSSINHSLGGGKTWAEKLAQSS